MANTANTGRGAGGGERTFPQLLSLIIGVAYLLVGILGFFVTGFDNFASETNETLLGFEVNPLHNIVHIIIGAAGIALSAKLGSARTYGWLLIIGYGATLIYGLFAVGNEDLNFLSLNVADNWLHFFSIVGGALIAFWPVRNRIDARR